VGNLRSGGLSFVGLVPGVLGGGKIRPGKLVSVALTNEPNIKGGAADCESAIGQFISSFLREFIS